MEQSQAEAIEELRVELAAQRLITRSIIAHLMIASDEPIAAALEAFEEAIMKMSPDQVAVADLDPAVHSKAFELAGRRAREMQGDIGALVRRPRKTRDAA